MEWMYAVLTEVGVDDKASIGGVVVSMLVSQPKNCWFESRRPLVHRLVQTGKVG